MLPLQSIARVHEVAPSTLQQINAAEQSVLPAHAGAELSFGWASMNALILRDTNLGALKLAVGCRSML